MTPLHVAATILIMTVVCGIVSASSNTVAISHQSYGNNYNAVKSDPREEEEYVTSFYSRVREKRRAKLEQQSKHQISDHLNHSLDHYFDHRLSKKAQSSSASSSSAYAARSIRGGGATPRLAQRSTTSSSSSFHHQTVSASRGGGGADKLFKQTDEGLKRQRHNVHPRAARSRDGHHSRHSHSHHRGSDYQRTVNKETASSSSNAARSVRGGGVAPRLAQRSSSASSTASAYHHHDLAHENSYNEDNMSEAYRGHHNHNSHPNDRVLENSYSHRSSRHTDEYDVYDDYNDEVQVQSQADEDEGDDTPDHHLGLLRVPCSIAINSGEATNHQGCSPQAKTPMAAYVDTGAQVTVISASAARRAGIYHLIDRRYAGRATGVGHCKVLGRIPARHVYFLLGEGCDEDVQDYGEFEDGDSWSDDDAWSDGDAWSDDDDYYARDYRGGGGEYHQDDNYHNEPSTSSNTVQMDGPALTVLEGTVTQGVDVLLGLDVLQDWEAEISMSPRRKSITVKKQRGSGGSSVVIPFATTAAAVASRSRYPRKVMHSQRMQEDEQQQRRTNSHHHHSRSRPANRGGHQHHKYVQHKDFDDDFEEEHPSTTSYHPHKSNYSHDTTNFSRDEFYDNNEEEDDDFSPTDSDIESDLDLLDQSGHKFPIGGSCSNGSRMSTNTKSIQEMEDELLGVVRASSRSDMERDDTDDEYDDDVYLRDVDDEEDVVMNGEGDIDMSGL